jgi:hypothetical protein
MALICASALSMGIVASSHPVWAGKQAKCSTPGQVVDRGHRWETIQAPEFGTEKKIQAGTSDPMNPIRDWEMALQDIAVAPYDPLMVFASDKDRLMRSTDGGCTWKLVYQTEETANNAFQDGDPEIILDILIPAAVGEPSIYLIIRNRSRERLVRSRDRGESWEELNESPLEYQGDLGEDPIVIAPSDPNTLYLMSTDTPGGTEVRAQQIPGGGVSAPQYFIEYLSVSHDGGKTWEELPYDNLLEAPSGNQTYVGFHVAVDPLNAKDIWAYSTARVRHSTDGGRTWTLINDVKWEDGQGADDIAIYHAPGQAAMIIVTPWIRNSGTGGYEPAFAFRTDDGGGSWYRQSIPEDTEGVVWGGTKNALVLYTYQGNFRYDERLARANASLPWVALPPPNPSREEVFVTQSPTVLYECHNCVIGSTSATIERYRISR